MLVVFFVGYSSSGWQGKSRHLCWLSMVKPPLYSRGESASMVVGIVGESASGLLRLESVDNCSSLEGQRGIEMQFSVPICSLPCGV